jgi:hypothetical protein
MSKLPIVLLVVLAVTATAQNRVKVPRVRFVQPNAAYDFYGWPFKIKVIASDVRNLANVRVRVFPNKTLATVQRFPLDVTDSGCYILKSRVECYQPSNVNPDIVVNEIQDFDLRCRDNVLQPTPFVLVIESDSDDDSQFLKIRPMQISRYFRHAYAFTVVPAPGQRCTTAPPQPPRTEAGRARAAAAEAHRVASIDTRDENCITTVE